MQITDDFILAEGLNRCHEIVYIPSLEQGLCHASIAYIAQSRSAIWQQNFSSIIDCSRLWIGTFLTLKMGNRAPPSSKRSSTQGLYQLLTNREDRGPCGHGGRVWMWKFASYLFNRHCISRLRR